MTCIDGTKIFPAVCDSIADRIINCKKELCEAIKEERYENAQSWLDSIYTWEKLIIMNGIKLENLTV